MKIYTQQGDTGETHLLDDQRMKDDLRVEAYGTIDELNAMIGEAVIRIPVEDHPDVHQHLLRIQHQLFDLGSVLAQVEPMPTSQDMVPTQIITELEEAIDQWEQECPKIKRFILPGGTSAAAALHLCRVVCRRAERRVVTLAQKETINPQVVRYLNRLSDLFFVLARTLNYRQNEADVEVDLSAHKKGMD